MAETTFTHAPAMLTLPEVASALGLSYQYVWRWLRAGRFKGAEQKPNGRHLVPASAVEAVKAERLARRNGKEASHG